MCVEKWDRMSRDNPSLLVILIWWEPNTIENIDFRLEWEWIKQNIEDGKTKQMSKVCRYF